MGQAFTDVSYRQDNENRHGPCPVYIRPGVSKKMRRRSIEVENALRGDGYKEFLFAMYGKLPTKWQKELTGFDRLRFITNALTRMRYVDENVHLEFEAKGPPGSQPKNLIPWFQHPNRKCDNWRIVFGHWSALGFMGKNNVIALDTGCVWGGALTAVRLDNGKNMNLFEISCAELRK